MYSLLPDMGESTKAATKSLKLQDSPSDLSEMEFGTQRVSSGAEVRWGFLGVHCILAYL